MGKCKSFPFFIWMVGILFVYCSIVKQNNNTIMAKRRTISFYECEHQGDLNNILEDMRSCGAKIGYTQLDVDEETCTIEYEVEDMGEFAVQFKDTESYDFIN